MLELGNSRLKGKISFIKIKGCFAFQIFPRLYSTYFYFKSKALPHRQNCFYFLSQQLNEKETNIYFYI